MIRTSVACCPLNTSSTPTRTNSKHSDRTSDLDGAAPARLEVWGVAGNARAVLRLRHHRADWSRLLRAHRGPHLETPPRLHHRSRRASPKPSLVPGRAPTRPGRSTSSEVGSGAQLAAGVIDLHPLVGRVLRDWPSPRLQARVTRRPHMVGELAPDKGVACPTSRRVCKPADGVTDPPWLRCPYLDSGGKMSADGIQFPHPVRRIRLQYRRGDWQVVGDVAVESMTLPAIGSSAGACGTASGRLLVRAVRYRRWRALSTVAARPGAVRPRGIQPRRLDYPPRASRGGPRRVPDPRRARGRVHPRGVGHTPGRYRDQQGRLPRSRPGRGTHRASGTIATSEGRTSWVAATDRFRG